MSTTITRAVRIVIKLQGLLTQSSIFQQTLDNIGWRMVIYCLVEWSPHGEVVVLRSIFCCRTYQRLASHPKMAKKELDLLIRGAFPQSSPNVRSPSSSFLKTTSQSPQYTASDNSFRNSRYSGEWWSVMICPSQVRTLPAGSSELFRSVETSERRSSDSWQKAIVISERSSDDLVSFCSSCWVRREVNLLFCF